MDPPGSEFEIRAGNGNSNTAVQRPRLRVPIRLSTCLTEHTFSHTHTETPVRQTTHMPRARLPFSCACGCKYQAGGGRSGFSRAEGDVVRGNT